jgi:hypothetical protein
LKINIKIRFGIPSIHPCRVGILGRTKTLRMEKRKAPVLKQAVGKAEKGKPQKNDEECD